jgi:glucans biosynthesis protein
LRKFVVGVEGGELAEMEARYDITAAVTLSRGKAENPHVITNRWRAVFDVTADGRDAINLRCFLRLNDHPLSESCWL